MNTIHGKDSKRPPSASTEWIDVTQFLKTTSSQMAPGEQIHAPKFKLQDIMSTIKVNGYSKV